MCRTAAWTFARTMIAAGVALALSAPAQAEEPSGRDLLRAADAAIAKAGTIAFHATREGHGGVATRTPAVVGDVTLSRIEGKSSLGWRVAARGELTEPGSTEARPFQVAYDGATYRSLRAGEATLVEREGDRAGLKLLDDGAMWLAGWALRWENMVTARVTPDDGITPDYNGVVVLDGEPCHVVHVDYSQTGEVDEFDVWWYLAASDSLPRRIESLYFDDHGDGIGTVTISGLVIDAPVEGAAFALAPPEGYKVDKGEPKAGARRSAPARRPAGPEVGAEAPNWTLTDAAGKPHTLADYKGKVVVLDFWATWCQPCTMAMPGIQRLHEEFKGRGVEVFGVNCWESGDPAGYMERKEFTYGLLLKADEVANAYGVAGIPAFFVIGMDGKLLHRASGFGPGVEKQLGVVIDEHLKANGK